MKKFILCFFVLVSLFFMASCKDKKPEEEPKQEEQPVQVEKFTVMWMNYDGEILQQDNDVVKGTMPSFTKATPTKPSDEYYDYLFDGWTPALSEVTSNRVYLAKFKQVQKEIIIPEDSYAIQWFNYDGTLLRVDYYKEGEMPEYHGEEPTRESTSEYDFSFASWLPEIKEVDGNATYMAQFNSSKNYQLISFDLDEGKSESYQGGEVRVHGLNQQEIFFDVIKEGYTFKGWMIDDELVMNETGNIIKKVDLSDGMVLKASYEKKEELILTIEYAFYDSVQMKVFKTTNSCDSEIAYISKGGLYPYNSTVSLFCEPQEGYDFLGWYYGGYLLSAEKEYNYMMWDKDITITAMIKVKNYNLSIFSDSTEDGKVRIYDIEANLPLKDSYEEVEVAVGSLITISNQTLTECTFLGWFNAEGDLVTPDAVYSFVMPAHDVELHAKWNRFDIDYELDGGTFNEDYPTYYSHNEDDPKSLNIPVPSKANYEFIGWSINGSVDLYTEIDTTWNEDLSLVARYKLDSTFDKYQLTPNGDGTFKLIGMNDFEDEELTLSPIITSIGNHAFENATSITKLVIPTSVKSMDAGALYGLDNLFELELPFVGTSASVTSGTDESYLGYLFGTSIPSGSSTSNYNVAAQRPYNGGLPPAFYIPNIKILRINGGNIGANSLSKMSSLLEVYVKGVREIGESAFVDDANLSIVDISNDTLKIGQFAFAVCPNIASMTVPFVGKDGTLGSSVVEHLFAGWFFGNRNDYATMKSIKQNGSSYVCPKMIVELRINGGGIYANALENMNIVNVKFYGTTIEDYAFLNSTVATFVSKSTNKTVLTRLGTSAFEGCKQLTRAQFDYGMNTWGDSVFRNCTSLRYCELNNKTYSTLGSNMFYNCTSLRELKINTNGKMTIPANAFYNCSKLANVYLSGSKNFSINDSSNSNAPFNNATFFTYSETEPTSSGHYWHWSGGYAVPWE